MMCRLIKPLQNQLSQKMKIFIHSTQIRANDRVAQSPSQMLWLLIQTWWESSLQAKQVYDPDRPCGIFRNIRLLDGGKLFYSNQQSQNNYNYNSQQQANYVALKPWDTTTLYNKQQI